MDRIEDFEVNSPRWLSLEDFEGEVWKDVVGYEGRYKVSNYGRVKSLARSFKAGFLFIHRADFILKYNKSNLGYFRVFLFIGKNKKMFSVHRLIALAFIPNPNNLPYINHKNEDKRDNRIENLEWCTAKYNTNYGTARERGIINRMRLYSKTICQYERNGKFIKKYDNLKNVTEIFGYDRHPISKVCNGHSYTAYGYVWRYGGDSFDKFPVNYNKQKHTSRKGRAIIKYDLNGKVVKVYKEGLRELLDDYDNYYSIKCCLSGACKTAHGFIWRYEGKDIPNPIIKRKIVKYSLDGIELSRYDSIAEAVRDMGYGCSSAIISNLNKETHKSYGYIWRYDNEEPPQPIVKYLIEQQNKNGERVALFESVRKATTAIGVKTTSSVYLCLNGKKRTAYGYKWRYVEYNK